ncbi:alpha/beta hydrolase [Alienimonas chondri]|uniref:Phospholipase/carboxylesterase/thioesterase domain-containing protein n=1 Tax=Alienimonas chondri TaxID=2681879 RepID=A0ABX1VJA8_9PLAN|nr:lipase family protein [Alienimonas chondri]NNJ27862.1 hypothetical protein [Alienimonas chondri]
MFRLVRSAAPLLIGLSAAVALSAAAGCEAEPAGGAGEGAADVGGVEDFGEAPFDPYSSAWDVPVPQAKAPVALANYEPAAADESSPGQEMLDRADLMKAAGQYDVARGAYEVALERDPDFAQAAYQLACNEALARNEEAARAAFERAMELGYADYVVARTDYELGTLRTAPDFPDHLKEIRRRYLKEAAAKVGTPFYIVPADVQADSEADPEQANAEQAGVPNAGGGERPPVMLLLHGYGDSHESYAPEATAWAKRGWAAVCVPGSLPTAEGGFTWPTSDETGYDTVDRQLRAILKDPGLSAVADTSKVYLLGFSQGANHAVMQTVLHPDRYAGAVGLSPGGRPGAIYNDPELNAAAPRPIALFYGTEEERGELLTRWSDALTAADWPALCEEFPGAHHFPRDWQDERRARVAAFLLGE